MRRRGWRPNTRGRLRSWGASWDRVSEFPVENAYIEISPDWVCEVLSPRTTALDRGDKRKVYEAQGVGHLWFVDPEARTQVLAFDGATYRVIDVFGEDAVVRAVPFDAIELELEALWNGEHRGCSRSGGAWSRQR